MFMDDALTRPASPVIERFIASTGWFGLIICFVMVGLAWLVTPTFEEMGHASLGTVVFFAVGLAINVVEWVTRGRHRLAALCLGLVALTATAALTGATVGLLNLYTNLAKPEIVADALEYRKMFVEGHREALGNVPFGLGLALLQAMMLAVAWRGSQHRGSAQT